MVVLLIFYSNQMDAVYIPDDAPHSLFIDEDDTFLWIICSVLNRMQRKKSSVEVDPIVSTVWGHFLQIANVQLHCAIFFSFTLCVPQMVDRTKNRYSQYLNSNLQPVRVYTILNC